MSIWRTALFILIASGLLGLVHVYVYRRLVRDTTRSVAIRKAAIAATVLVLALFVLTRLLLRVTPGPWFVPLSTALWCWIGYATYLLFSLGLADALRGSRWLWARMVGPRKQPSERVAPASPEPRLFVSRAIAGGAFSIDTAST